MAFSLPISHEQDFRHLSASQAPAQTGHPLWGVPSEILIFRENEIIFREGEVPRGLYLLKSGAVKMVAHQKHARGRLCSAEYLNKVVAPGELFGFRALIQESPYDDFAKTLKPSEIQVFPKETIQQMMSSTNPLMKMLLTQLVRDLETNESQNQTHYLASVQERIAHQLLSLADKFGTPASNGVSLNLRLTRHELAQLAGTINESLSRHLTELKDEGVLEVRGKEIVIKNREALVQRSRRSGLETSVEAATTVRGPTLNLN
ncbi:MAG: Crp/Fnr family transcriptional regulator [Bdellovibrio sp.]